MSEGYKGHLPSSEEELLYYRRSALHCAAGLVALVGGMALSTRLDEASAAYSFVEFMTYVGAGIGGINLRRGIAYLRMGDDAEIRKRFTKPAADAGSPGSSIDDKIEKK